MVTRITRRRFLRIIAFGVGAGFLPTSLGCSSDGVGHVSRTRVLMGTLVNITVADTSEASARAAADACLARMAELESIVSRFDHASQLSRLNRTGCVTNAHPALLDVLRQARYVSELSAGAFDCTVKPLVDLYQARFAAGALFPDEARLEEALRLVDFRKIVLKGTTVRLAREGMGVTLDGIAKGYIVDAGVAVLRKEGFENVLVEAGGDLAASGCKASGQPWRVGIRSPRPGHGDVLKAISLEDRAAATSGDYEQAYSADFEYHHIIDPRSGRSPRQTASVTIVAPTVTLADGLSTAVMVSGVEGGAKIIRETPHCEGYIVTKDMTVIRV